LNALEQKPVLNENSEEKCAEIKQCLVELDQAEKTIALLESAMSDLENSVLCLEQKI
jgi:hypothetical protein